MNRMLMRMRDESRAAHWLPMVTVTVVWYEPVMVGIVRQLDMMTTSQFNVPVDREVLWFSRFMAIS